MTDHATSLTPQGPLWALPVLWGSSTEPSLSPRPETEVKAPDLITGRGSQDNLDVILETLRYVQKDDQTLSHFLQQASV